MIETPQSFVTRQECDKVAFQNGFRRSHGETDGWWRYSSTTAQGAIWLARDATGGWLLAVDHWGVVEELDDFPDTIEGPGLARYAFADLGELYGLMPRVYQLAASLPDAPLAQFQAKVMDLPTSTEGRKADCAADRAGCLSVRTARVLAGPLSPYRDHGRAPASCLAHRSLERLRDRRRTPRRAQWPASFGPLGHRVRPRPRELRQCRAAAVLASPWRASALGSPLATADRVDLQAP